MISNMTRIEQLLDDPNPEISLDDLKSEINELAKLRDKSRVAFCKRLAVAYLMIVGRPMTREAPEAADSKRSHDRARRIAAPLGRCGARLT